MSPKSLIKEIVNAVAFVLVLPLGFLAWVEMRFAPHGEFVFAFFAHTVALLPGMPGMYLRRAYYRLTLDYCDKECFIGFGSVFSHRQAVVEKDVYIGTYALIGSARLGEGTLIGSRASLLSGGGLHARSAGGWTASDYAKLRQINLGRQVWVGEGCIIFADIGEGGHDFCRRRYSEPRQVECHDGRESGALRS